MKHLSFILVLVSIFFANVQIRGQSIEDQILQSLSTLDQSQTSTGLLDDRVPHYFPINVFDGKIRADSLLSGTAFYTLMYGMLDWMHVDTLSFDITVDSLSRRFNELKERDTVTLSGMYFHYDVIKEYALDSNLITEVDSHYYDVPGRTESPYQVDTFWAVTAVGYQSYELNQVYHWSADNLFSNVSGPWDSISIDFGDGQGYHIASPDQSWFVTYSDTGQYLIRIKKTSPNGETLLAFTKMVIEELPNNPPPPPGGHDYGENQIIHIITNTAGDEGVEIINWQNTQCGDTRIRKPLILIDGFDPGDNHNGNGINRLIRVRVPDGDDSTPDPTIGQLLHGDDYDVFYLNFINSTIDIRRNAEYIQEAIEWINDRKRADGSVEKNIVIGNSMGGVVGKWALRSMELNPSEDHETELYIAFDGAMKGANIIMGMQMALNHISGYELFGKKLIEWTDWGLQMFNPITEAKTSLDSKAARQMLYYHRTAGQDKWEWNGDLFCLSCKEIEASDLRTMHDEFYIEFAALGNLDIREIAISNGAIRKVTEADDGDDKDQKFHPGFNLLDDEQSFADFFALIIGEDIGDFWKWLIDLGFEGPSKAREIKLTTRINALNDGGNSRVYEGDMMYKPFLSPKKYHYRDTRLIKHAKPYDSAPGGMTPLIDADGDGGGASFAGAFSWKYAAFCFIPTISSLSLDIEHPYFDGFDLTNRPSILNVHTPFNSYVGSITIEDQPFGSIENPNLIILNEINQPHVSFNGEIIAFWLATLLDIRLQPDLDDETFNFGKASTEQLVYLPQIGQTDDYIDFNLDVFNSGELWVNKDHRIGYIDNQNNIENGYPQKYAVHIIRDKCTDDPTLVHVKNNGYMQIGDLTVSNVGVVEIHEDATLQVSTGGKIQLSHYSKIIVHEGGKLIIEQGGLIETDWNAQIIIEEGGQMIVRDGSILQAMNNTVILAKNGGQFVIEDGSEIRLWDGPPVRDGEATIRIRGELVVKGGFKFSGNGYFQFDAGNTLTLEAPFALRGISRRIRFIQLNHYAKLVVKDYGMFIRNGKVTYEGLNNAIQPKDDIIFAADTASFQGNGAMSQTIAIDASGSRRIILDSCVFNSILTGVIAYGVGARVSGTDLIMNQCVFSDYVTGLYATQTHKIRISDCAFDGSGNTSSTGLKLENCTEIVGVGFDSKIVNNKTGIYQEDIPYLIIKDSEVSSNETGVLLTGNSNVFVRRSVFATNTGNGIEVTDPYFLSKKGYESGLVDISCSVFMNNGAACVGGDDILLNVDGAISGHGGNAFIITGDQKYFNISYSIRSPISIEATNNFWDDDADDQPTYNVDYKFTPDVPINYLPKLDGIPTNCSGGTPCTGGGICDCDDVPIGDASMMLGGAYEDAIMLFEADDIEGAELAFIPIAEASDNSYPEISGMCLLKLDISRIFAPGGSPQIITDNKEVDLFEGQFLIYPNPGSDIIRLEIPDGRYKMRVYTALGKQILLRTVTGASTMDIGDWHEGIYFIELVNEMSNEMMIKKIVKRSF